MFINSLAQLRDHLAKAMPYYMYECVTGIVYIKHGGSEQTLATVEITNRGYKLTVPRSNHEGNYTDVESLIGEIHLMLMKKGSGNAAG